MVLSGKSTTEVETKLHVIDDAQWRKSKHGDDCSCCTNKSSLIRHSGIELGHTFYLGTKYSKPFSVQFSLENGSTTHIAEMGCYGLGVTRILAAIVEAHHDEYVDYVYGTNVTQ